MIKDKRIVLALSNPAAERWFQAQYPEAEVVSYHPQMPKSADVLLVAQRSRLGAKDIGVDDVSGIVAEFIGSSPLVVAVLTDEKERAELASLGVPLECLVLQDGAPVLASRIKSLLEEGESEGRRCEPLVAGCPVRRSEYPEPPAVLGGAPAAGGSAGECPSCMMAPAPAAAPRWDLLADKLVVVFPAVKGGAGRTTLAVSLAAHAAGMGKKVLCLDLAAPGHAWLHVSEGREPAAGDGGPLALTATRWGTVAAPRRFKDLVSVTEAVAARPEEIVIVDLPGWMPGLEELAQSARAVAVLDQDLQALETLRRDGGILKNAVVVVNKVGVSGAGLPVEVIAGVLEVQPVVIGLDIQGCTAALARGVPALDESATVAGGVGEIAARIFGGGG
jgi:hypothetical protein